MKRSTLVTLGVFGLLLALWVAKDWKSAPKGPTPLSLDGYAGNLSEQDFRAATKDQLPPVKSLIVKKKDETIALTQQAQELPKDVTPDKSKPVEAKWSVARTRKGKTSQAKGQTYKANAMAEVFGRSIRSTFAKEIKASELAEYGLDADHAIDVEATTDKGTLKLRIGTVDKPQEGGEPTTWAQDPGHPEVVYQVAGRDLRGPFDVAWSELRDRALLTLDLSALDRIEVANPTDPRAKRFVVSRPAAGDKKGRDPGEGWKIEEPAGYDAGDIGEWAKSLERLSASEFLDASEVSDKKTDTGLDDPAVAARVTLREGSNQTVLVFGKADEASAQKDVWLRIEGRDDVYKIASYSRDQALQKFDQVRNRALLGGLKAKDVTSFTLTGPDGAVLATRTDNQWSVAHADRPISATALDTYLADVEGIKVDYAADVTPAAVGIDQPEWRLTLRFPDKTVQVALTKEKDGNLYGRAGLESAPGDLFKLASWSGGRLKKTVKDFEDKHLLRLTADDVAKVDVAANGASAFSVEKQADGWKIKDGDKVTAAKPEAVADWIAALVAMERATLVTDKKDSEIGLDKDFSSVTLTTKAGQATTVRLSSQKAGEEPYVAVVAVGKPTTIATVSAFAATHLQKKAEALAGQ